MSKKLFCILVLCLFSDYIWAGTPLITAQTLGTPRQNFSGTVGFKFTVGVSNISVDSIGRWVIAGNSQTHLLKIYDWTAASIIASVTVNCNGATAGQYLYGSITPVTLVAGQAYTIESTEVSGGDFWYNDDTTINTYDTTKGTINGAVFSENQLDKGGAFFLRPYQLHLCCTRSRWLNLFGSCWCV